MDLILNRLEFRIDGIFGCIHDIGDKLKLVTLERSYNDRVRPEAKIPAGKYLCKRGIHQYKSGRQYETFEITGVPGHSSLLFHVGNQELDSEGCILLGSKILNLGILGHGAQMIQNSKVAFETFMHAQTGADEFWLEIVVDPAVITSLALN